MEARVSLELPFNMSNECTLMKVVKARENDVTLISEDGERCGRKATRALE